LGTGVPVGACLLPELLDAGLTVDGVGFGLDDAAPLCRGRGLLLAVGEPEEPDVRRGARETVSVATIFSSASDRLAGACTSVGRVGSRAIRSAYCSSVKVCSADSGSVEPECW